MTVVDPKDQPLKVLERDFDESGVGARIYVVAEFPDIHIAMPGYYHVRIQARSMPTARFVTVASLPLEVQFSA